MKKPIKRFLIIMLTFCSLLLSANPNDLTINAADNSVVNTTDVFPDISNVPIPNGWQLSPSYGLRVSGNEVYYRIERMSYSYRLKKTVLKRSDEYVYLPRSIPACDADSPNEVVIATNREIKILRIYRVANENKHKRYLYITNYVKKTGSGIKTVESYYASDFRKAIPGWVIKSSKIQTETYTTTTFSNTGWLETAPSNAVGVVDTKRQYYWVERTYQKVVDHQATIMSVSLNYSFDDTTCLVVSPGTTLSASHRTRTTYYYLKAGMLKSVLSKNVVQYADVLNNAIITGLNSTPDCEYFNILRNATSCTVDEIDHSVMQTLQGLVADNLIIPEETLWTIPQASERALASIGFITDGVCSGVSYNPDAINEVLSLDDDDIFMIRMDETYYGEYDGEPDIAKEFSFEAVEGTTVNLKSLYTAGYTLSSMDENSFMNMLHTFADSWVLPYNPPETTDVVGTYFGTTGCASHFDVAKALLRYEVGLVIDPIGFDLTEQIDNEAVIETLNEKILSVIRALNG